MKTHSAPIKGSVSANKRRLTSINANTGLFIPSLPVASKARLRHVQSTSDARRNWGEQSIPSRGWMNQNDEMLGGIKTGGGDNNGLP